MSIAGSFNVSSSSGVLGSWLSQSSTGTGALGALLTNANSTKPSTTAALSAGALTTSQQRVLAAVGDNNGPLTIPWNSNGTEPTTVANIHSAGWLKLDKKVVENGKVTGGVYELTAVGKAIYQRTGGGSATGDSSALTSADTNGGAAATATSNLQSSVSSLTSILGSLGVSV